MLPGQSRRAVLLAGHLAQLAVGPDGAEEADRHRDQEDEPPLDRGEHPAEDEADERAAEAGHLVDAEGHAPLVLGEGVGHDGRGVGDEQRRAHPLEDAHDDEPQRGRRAAHPGDREQQREERVDGEAEVVHPHPTVHVAEAPEAHHEHARDDHEAQDHPQQVEAVARSSGSMWMPRKMSGRAISMIEVSIIAISEPSVVFDRTTHL